MSDTLRETDELRGFVAAITIKTEAELHKTLVSKLPADTLTIHENVCCVKFVQGIPAAGELFESGRSFSESLEIRWRKLNDEFRLVALSEDVETLNGLDVSGQNYKVQDRSLLLWGEYNPNLGKFIEVRIPKFLEYPVKSLGDTGKRLSISARQYLEDGVIQFTRYKGIAWKRK